MNLKYLILCNFRKYEKTRFNFHRQFTVLIGDNGAGKTTILDALSILLGTYFQGSGIQTGRGSISKDDVRLVITTKEGQLFREPQKTVYLRAEGCLHNEIIRWRRDVGDRGGMAKNLVNIGAEDRNEVSSGANPDLPILLYYGAGRLWDIHRGIETEKPNSQLDAYRFCLDPKSDLKAFEKWFKKLSFTQLQKKQEIPALTTVKQAVLTCIQDATDFYHDTEEDQIMLCLDHEGIMPFSYLSDGYRNIIAMVADIAQRASRLNPHFGLDAARQTSGVVLIDEIDLHLHPKWQRHVVEDLKNAFPKLQFIVTTHSPFILQSLAPGEVIDLNQTLDIKQIAAAPAGVAAPGPANEFSNRSIEDIVEEIMGVNEPQRSHRYQMMFDAAKEYYSVLQESKGADDARKEALKRKLDELSAPFSDNVAYHAFLEMERLAAGLGCTDEREAE